MRATRRGFLAGAAAGTAGAAGLPALARAADLPASTPKAARTVVRRGRAIAASPKGDRLVIAHAARSTVEVRGPRGASRLVDVGGQPVDVAVAPRGTVAAVLTAAWDDPGLALVDLRTGAVRRRRVGQAPDSVVFSRDGRRIIVTGGEQEGRVTILDALSLKLLVDRPVGIAPRGVAAGPGPVAWIALNGDARVVRVDTGTGRVTKTLHTDPLPDRLALSRPGTRLLVTHGGFGVDHVSEITVADGRVRRRRAGRLPAAVTWTARGKRLVALGGDGAVVVLPKSGTPRRLRTKGGAPRGLAVAGSRAWTVDALSGVVSKVHA